MPDKAEILVRLKTACYSLEQATIVAREQHSPHTQQLSEVLDRLDQLYAEIAADRKRAAP